MKTLIKSLLLTLILTGAAGSTSIAGTNPVDVKEVKEKNLVVFKATKKLIGASVEVIHSSGDVVTAQILAKRKMIIDFSDVKEGSYTIRITKGKQTEEFAYAKK